MKATKNSYVKSLNERLDKAPSNEELWIVSQYLRAYNTTFEPNKILKQPNNSKIDVIFNECQFQVKKIIFPADYKPNEKDESLKKKIINSYGREQFIWETVDPKKEYTE